MNFKSIKKYRLISGIILGIAISIVAFFFYFNFLMPRYQENLVDQETYQAVFLEGGDIYFGKLQNIDSQFPVLKDVYYVRVESAEATSGQLVKLGQIEPHGPKDEMIINRNHILFWENLRPDSRIIETIRSLKINQ